MRNTINGMQARVLELTTSCLPPRVPCVADRQLAVTACLFPNCGRLRRDTGVEHMKGGLPRMLIELPVEMSKMADKVATRCYLYYYCYYCYGCPSHR
jgi:hypothetical protein